jgi:predicted nucleic acid-binding protein
LEAARELLLGEVLAAPDLMIIECANVLWAKERRGTINRDRGLSSSGTESRIERVILVQERCGRMPDAWPRPR